MPNIVLPEQQDQNYNYYVSVVEFPNVAILNSSANVYCTYEVTAITYYNGNGTSVSYTSTQNLNDVNFGPTNTPTHAYFKLPKFPDVPTLTAEMSGFPTYSLTVDSTATLTTNIYGGVPPYTCLWSQVTTIEGPGTGSGDRIKFSAFDVKDIIITGKLLGACTVTLKITDSMGVIYTITKNLVIS